MRSKAIAFQNYFYATATALQQALSSSPKFPPRKSKSETSDTKEGEVEGGGFQKLLEAEATKRVGN